MKNCETVIYKGKAVIVVDIAHTTADETIYVLEQAKKKIAALPSKSGLILTDATDTVYNTATSAAMKEFSNHNTPFIKASAVVGAEGLRAVLVQAIARLTRRAIRLCKTRDEALDWLASHNN